VRRDDFLGNVEWREVITKQDIYASTYELRPTGSY
jgi:hypothetical protein